MGDSNEILDFVECGEFHERPLKCELCMKKLCSVGLSL
jgi:hypothetical protein